MTVPVFYREWLEHPGLAKHFFIQEITQENCLCAMILITWLGMMIQIKHMSETTSRISSWNIEGHTNENILMQSVVLRFVWQSKKTLARFLSIKNSFFFSSAVPWVIEERSIVFRTIGGLHLTELHRLMIVWLRGATKWNKMIYFAG
jgi:hypothetical protein